MGLDLLVRSCKCLRVKGSDVEQGRTAESVARTFLNLFQKGEIDDMMSMLSDDAVMTDAGRGVKVGSDAIKAALDEFASYAPAFQTRILTLLTDGKTVMIERADRYEMGGHSFGYQMATAFSINAAGKITRWHEYYDVKEIEAQVLAAGISIPDE
jgi:limonene-1,2-epoxide hydrolase